jgi:hypothetical protein
MVANPYIVESRNAIFISAGWLGERFLAKNQGSIDKVIVKSGGYEPIEIEIPWNEVNGSLRHPRYYKI